MEREELLKKYTYVLEENGRIEQLKQIIHDDETEYKKKLKAKENVAEWGFVAGTIEIILFIALIACFIGAMQIFKDNYLGWLCLSGIFIITGLIRIVYSVSCVKCRDKAEIEKARIHNEEIIPAYKKYEESKQKLKETLLVTKLESVEEQIPEAYRSEDAVQFFIQALKNGRADTEKELYNLYEEEKHRRKLEEINEKQLQTLEESLTHCPSCGSTNCTMMIKSKTESSSFGWGDACCGYICLGPVGLLCGMCGMGSETTTETYWQCRNCGKKFSD